MPKRFVSVILSVMMILSLFLPTVYADNVPNDGALPDAFWDTFNHAWGEATQVSCVCPKCGAGIRKKDGGTCPFCGFNASIDDGTVNNYRPGFEAGGGSASPGGVGRNPAGYAGEGTPSVSYEGNNIYKLEPYFWSLIDGFDPKYYPTACPQWGNYPVLNIDDYPDVSFSNNTLSIYNSHTYNGLGVVYGMYAPVAGKYSIYKNPDVAQITFSYTNGDGPYTAKLKYVENSAIDAYFKAGSSLYWRFSHSFGRLETRKKIKITASDLYVYCEPSQSTIIQQNNITINNNTWNGNIYTDNSTNLTYIYPQYTTINENNETITNISNNPIIYNNETKQYYTYNNETKNYYYITINAPESTPTPTPSTSPVPTWQPGGGATHGGGVGRHPYDADKSDWTLHYYILNNRRYDAYYALKKTEVDAQTKLPWVDNKKYISTTQIPIANGQYTVTVPEGVYWRVWQWDETSQTLTGLNSSNWHSSMNYFLFNATGEYIFEFCKADGSDFNSAKDVTLKLKNDRITDYEDGGTEIENKPIVPETQNLIIPKMNANSFTDEHGTWVASGSSKYSDVFDFFYAFDRSTANFWETNASPSYLQIEIPDPENYYIDGYIMRISKFNNRYSKDWTLQGSDDGKTWDDLDKQTGQNLSDLEEHKYTLNLRKAYKYYRLNMSNYASSMCSLSHFNLLGYDAKDVTFPTPDPGGSGGGSGTTPTPTPAPTPDGGSDGSGGGSGGNPLKWLAELLKDIVEGIFKAIWKLITSIFGFLIWLVSLLGKVLPFIPAEGLAALSAAAIIITVIRIIKFILGR